MDSVSEGPGQDIVVGTTHDDEIDREVVLIVVSCRVHTEAHLVAGLVGEEWRAVHDRFEEVPLPGLGLCHLLTNVLYLPRELAGARVEGLRHEFLLLLLLGEGERELLDLLAEFEDGVCEADGSLRCTGHQVITHLSARYLFRAPEFSHGAGDRFLCTVVEVVRLFALARDFTRGTVVATEYGVLQARGVVRGQVREDELHLAKLAGKTALGTHFSVDLEAHSLEGRSTQLARDVDEIAGLRVRRLVGELPDPRTPSGVFRTLYPQSVYLQPHRIVGERVRGVYDRPVLGTDVVARVQDGRDALLAVAVSARGLIRRLQAAEADWTLEVVW